MSPAGAALLEALAHTCRTLEAAGLAHVFIGGIAVSAWARPRTTLDLDVLVVSAGSAAGPVLGVLQAAGFCPDPAGVQVEQRLAGFRVTFQPSPQAPPVALDVLVSDNPVVVEIVRRAERRSLAGVDLQVPAAEDLIVLKLQAGRPQDLADARAVLDARATVLDRDLLRSQARIFGLEGDLEPLLEP